MIDELEPYETCDVCGHFPVADFALLVHKGYRAQIEARREEWKRKHLAHGGELTRVRVVKRADW